MTYSAEPMLGLTPAVWITEATVPRRERGLEQAVDRLAVGDVAVDGRDGDRRGRPAFSTASSRRSCRTSQRTRVWSRPTTFAVARPMPPAPPVMTATLLMALDLLVEGRARYATAQHNLAGRNWCLLGKVGTQSGGDDAVECPVGQEARQRVGCRVEAPAVLIDRLQPIHDRPHQAIVGRGAQRDGIEPNVMLTQHHPLL